MLINKFRGSGEIDLKMTLTSIYNKTFSSYYIEIKNEVLNNVEEIEILEEIKQELIQEELDWYLIFYFNY